MEVSTFELLAKRIAPPPTSPTLARRVVQGYFLTISNLEDEEFRYTLEFQISLPDPPDSDRTLAGNATVLLDVAGANQPLTLSPVSAAVGTTRFSTSFRLGGKQTASLQLLPNLTPALLADPNPDLEVRGFVRLRLPAVFRFQSFPPRFRRVPQSDSPVKVLLNPEIRGTFLPNNFPSGGGDFDQINYPLVLASGKGLNTIEPESGRLLVIPDVQIPQLIEELPLRNRPTIDFAALDEKDHAAALVEVISQIEPSQANLQNVSDLLSKLNVPIAMELVE
ncbi:MAG: hypothetical protein WBG70_08470 [Spirulinaceae cyanobacterium]